MIVDTLNDTANMGYKSYINLTIRNIILLN